MFTVGIRGCTSSVRNWSTGQWLYRLDDEQCAETSSNTPNMAVQFRIRETTGSNLEPAKAILPDMFRGLLHSIQENNGQVPQIRRQRSSSTCFQIHSSLISRRCSSKYSELLTASLNKPCTYWGTSLGSPRRYGDNIKMDNCELDSENGNSTPPCVAQRTHKYNVLHNM